MSNLYRFLHLLLYSLEQPEYYEEMIVVIYIMSNYKSKYTNISN